MYRGEASEAVGVWPQCKPLQPWRRILLKGYGTCISHVEVPAGTCLYGYPTVASRVAVERHQPHLGLKGQPDGRQAVPGLSLISV